MKVIDTDKSLRRYQIAGFAGVAIVMAVIGSWSAFASIRGAVIAPAVIMAESYSKRIQHKEGGIIKEIKVIEAYFKKAIEIMNETTVDLGKQQLKSA